MRSRSIDVAKYTNPHKCSFLRVVSPVAVDVLMYGGVIVDEFMRSDVPYRLASLHVKKCQDDDPASDDAKASSIEEGRELQASNDTCAPTQRHQSIQADPFDPHALFLVMHPDLCRLPLCQRSGNLGYNVQ